MPQGESKSRAKLWIGAAARVALFPVVFLLPAGTWRWWEAWVITALYLAYATGVAIYLARNDPALLRERMNANPAQEGQQRWDKVLMAAMLVPGFAMFIVPGLDVVRLGWSAAFPPWMEIVAMAVHLPCFLLIGRVMRENTFLSRVVKIDEQRGHEVIRTGPYAVVRHPMYAGVIVMVFAMPVALGSRWALIPAALLVALLVARTALEDRTLHRELEGYVDYAEKVRCRLVPGIW